MLIPLFNFLLYSLSFFINVEIFSTDRKRCVFFLYWERERFTEFSFSKIFFISFFLKENKSFLLQFVVKHYHDKAFVHCCSITKLALSISFIFTFCFFLQSGRVRTFFICTFTKDTRAKITKLCIRDNKREVPNI